MNLFGGGKIYKFSTKSTIFGTDPFTLKNGENWYKIILKNFKKYKYFSLLVEENLRTYKYNFHFYKENFRVLVVLH